MSFYNRLPYTIVAPITATGGAIAILRLSGKDAITITDTIFVPKNKAKWLQAQSHTMHYGSIYDPSQQLIDDVLVSIFKCPHSYTGENVIEISLHGSAYILQTVIRLLIHNGAILAEAGEFTLRAFLNKKMDLSQAEAVADVIASESKAAHTIAMQQLKGGFSNHIQYLRSELIRFAALIELELDFSTEDVTFADRTQLYNLVLLIQKEIALLLSSFQQGNAIKKGIQVAIIGKPNAGKSTLLNTLLNEEKAIVTAIAGTTRDFIEDTLLIEGILFRFVDTAGLRNTHDIIEKIGVERSIQKMKEAHIILQLITPEEQEDILEIQENQSLLVVRNKIDTQNSMQPKANILDISAKEQIGIEELCKKLVEIANQNFISTQSATTVTNSRHYDSLYQANEHIKIVLEHIPTSLPTDILAIDIRACIDSLGTITGEVTNDEVLGAIFSKFCIGK